MVPGELSLPLRVAREYLFRQGAPKTGDLPAALPERAAALLGAYVEASICASDASSDSERLEGVSREGHESETVMTKMSAIRAQPKQLGALRAPYARSLMGPGPRGRCD